MVLMDLLMPGMNGAEATRQIMQRSPCPILVVTATVAGNYALVCEALSYGAFDAVATPVLGDSPPAQAGAALLAKLAHVDKIRSRLQAQARVVGSPRPRGWPRLRRATPAVAARRHWGVHGRAARPASDPLAMAEGLSRGGSCRAAHQRRLCRFVGRLAGRRLQVDGPHGARRRPAAGRGRLGGGNRRSSGHAAGRHACLHPRSRSTTPSALRWTCSSRVLARHWRRPSVAVLLTGIGRDGAQGLLELRRAGWHTDCPGPAHQRGLRHAPGRQPAWRRRRNPSAGGNCGRRRTLDQSETGPALARHVVGTLSP